MSLSSLQCQAGSLPPVPPGKPLSNVQVSLFFLLWLFVLVLCCPEVFLAKQAAVSPEGACADPLRLHTASGSCLRSKGPPEAGPEPSAAARVWTQEDSAPEQSLGQSRAAKEVTGRVTASQTGTGGQPLPSSLSWSSWGTLASQPLGFGARRPLGSWPLLLESWSPPPHLMRARLPHPCGERPPHSGGPGQGGGDRRSGGVRKPTRPGAWPWDAGAKAKGLPAGSCANPAGDCQWRAALIAWVLNQKSAQILKALTVSVGCSEGAALEASSPGRQGQKARAGGRSPWEHRAGRGGIRDLRREQMQVGRGGGQMLPEHVSTSDPALMHHSV